MRVPALVLLMSSMALLAEAAVNPTNIAAWVLGVALGWLSWDVTRR